VARPRLLRSLLVRGLPKSTTLSPGDHVTAWVYVVPGSAIAGIGLELGEIVGGGVRAYRGDNPSDSGLWSTIPFRIGDLPVAGGWMHLSVPVATLVITETRAYVNGGIRRSGRGTVCCDRFGKKPGS
jgi:hypothetical protein